MNNLYDTLGISKTASPEDIKKAYRKLAKKYHPDKNPGDKKAEEQFKEATKAYEILKDPNKRSTFDRFGSSAFEGPRAGSTYTQRAHPGGFGSPFEDFDIFDGNEKQEYEVHFDFGRYGMDSMHAIFEEMLRNTGRTRSRKANADIKKEVFITLEELDIGARKDVYYEKNEMCPSCKAMAPHQDWCSKCAGKGVVKVNASIQNQLSPGLTDGQEIRIKGSGNFVPSYKTGDLILIIRLEKHPDFIKDGYNLYTTKKITFPEAALGTVLELENLRKQKLNINIHAGIQTGTQLVLHGQGLLKPDPHRGNLFLTITIGTPVDLTDGEKELYLKLKEYYIQS